MEYSGKVVIGPTTNLDDQAYGDTARATDDIAVTVWGASDNGGTETGVFPLGYVHAWARAIRWTSEGPELGPLTRVVYPTGETTPWYYARLDIAEVMSGRNNEVWVVAVNREWDSGLTRIGVLTVDPVTLTLAQRWFTLGYPNEDRDHAYNLTAAARPADGKLVVYNFTYEELHLVDIDTEVVLDSMLLDTVMGDIYALSFGLDGTLGVWADSYNTLYAWEVWTIDVTTEFGTPVEILEVPGTYLRWVCPAPVEGGWRFMLIGASYWSYMSTHFVEPSNDAPDTSPLSTLPRYYGTSYANGEIVSSNHFSYFGLPIDLDPTKPYKIEVDAIVEDFGGSNTSWGIGIYAKTSTDQATLNGESWDYIGYGSVGQATTGQSITGTLFIGPAPYIMGTYADAWATAHAEGRDTPIFETYGLRVKEIRVTVNGVTQAWPGPTVTSLTDINPYNVYYGTSWQFASPLFFQEPADFVWDQVNDVGYSVYGGSAGNRDGKLYERIYQPDGTSFALASVPEGTLPGGPQGNNWYFHGVSICEVGPERFILVAQGSLGQFETIADYTNEIGNYAQVAWAVGPEVTPGAGSSARVLKGSQDTSRNGFRRQP